MLFMVIERFRNRNARAVYGRYNEKGRMMPDGLRYVGNWTETNFDRCFQLMESDDPSLFKQWIDNWKVGGLRDLASINRGRSFGSNAQGTQLLVRVTRSFN